VGLSPPAPRGGAHDRGRAAEPVARRPHRARGLRELLLAQSSDWTFIMRTGTTVPYATKRFEDHVVQLDRLCDEIDAGVIDEMALAALEARDDVFPGVDYRLYAS
jgi:1,4-alpha-glucan branching enzyme